MNRGTYSPEGYRTLAEAQQDHVGALKEMTGTAGDVEDEGHRVYFILFQMVGRISEGYAARQ